MTVVVPLVGLAICLLAAFLYVMGHPGPREPVFIRRFRLDPSVIPEYIGLLARGLFHSGLLRSGATQDGKSRSLPGDELIPKPRVHETWSTTMDVRPGELWPDSMASDIGFRVPASDNRAVGCCLISRRAHWG